MSEAPILLRQSFTSPPTWSTQSNPVPTLTASPTLSEYETLALVNTTGYSQLLLQLRYLPEGESPAVDGSALSLLAEAWVPRAGGLTQVDEVDFTPIGVLDATVLVEDTTPAEVALEPGYAFRRGYSAEIRFDPFKGRASAGAIDAAPVQATLQFDVSPYRGFRFRVAEAVVGVTSYVDLFALRVR